MKNNDALKKHHFWILLGFVPLFVLIAVLVVVRASAGPSRRRTRRSTRRPRRSPPRSQPQAKGAHREAGQAGRQGGRKQGRPVEGQLGAAGRHRPQDRSSKTWPRPVHLAEVRPAQGHRAEGPEVRRQAPQQPGPVRRVPKPEVYLAEYSNAKPDGYRRHGHGRHGRPDPVPGGWEKVLGTSTSGATCNSPPTRSG